MQKLREGKNSARGITIARSDNSRALSLVRSSGDETK
jgi:hypothetical protein